jgi:16S rRNA (cytosine967-C5)-methyltransferase
MAVRPGTGARGGVMPEGAEPARWSPYGFTLPGGDPSALVVAGVAAVQDEASQLAALLLARAEADGAAEGPACWLDLCAGPGGKARMLHGLAALDGARLLAAEIYPHRAQLVASAVGHSASQARLAGAEGPFGENGPSAPAGVIVADGRQPAWRDGGFDRVLVDVPCTGLGALRRRPEARWRKTPGDLGSLGELQRSLLRSALAAARPGGVVAYVTCSPVPAETSDVVAAVAGEVEILDAPALLPEVPGLRAAADGRFAQFWPHRHGTDAIFVALLRVRS